MFFCSCVCILVFSCVCVLVFYCVCTQVFSSICVLMFSCICVLVLCIYIRCCGEGKLTHQIWNSDALRFLAAFPAFGVLFAFLSFSCCFFVMLDQTLYQSGPLTVLCPYLLVACKDRLYTLLITLHMYLQYGTMYLPQAKIVAV